MVIEHSECAAPALHDIAFAAELVETALHVQPLSLTRQTLTDSGNVIFQVTFAGGQPMALRISPRAGAYAYTGHNLNVLRQLGLPVQTVVAAGPAGSGGAFVLLNWMAGRDLVYELDAMTETQMATIARSIAGYQRRVAGLPEGRAYGWAPIGMRAASARWTDIFGKPAPAAESAVNDIVVLDQLRRRLRALRRRLEPYFATLRPVCFLDDLTTKNVLAESGQLQGLIDFDVVCYGDPLMAVGTTLAHLTVDSGDIGHFYGEELLRSYGATGDALRAVYFYGALWLVGFVAAAESSGNAERARKLETMADAMLRPGETP